MVGDLDDFLDPNAVGARAVLISRLVVGAASNVAGDGFRPLGGHVGYVHLANSFSWRSVQFGYKRSEMRGEGGEAARWVSEGSATLGNYGRLQKTRNATPRSKDTLNAAWYWPVAGGDGIPVGSPEAG